MKNISHPSELLSKPFESLLKCQNYCRRSKNCTGCSQKCKRGCTWNSISSSIDKKTLINDENAESEEISLKPGKYTFK